MHSIDTLRERARQRVRFLRRTDQRAERADHVENSGDVALIEGMDRDIGAHQVGDDVGLQVGEGQHQIRLEREIFGTSAEMKADTRGFSLRTRAGRTA